MRSSNGASPDDRCAATARRPLDLLTGPAARAAFDVEREPASLRDRYGRNPLGQNLLLARRLIEAGVRLVSVVAWTGLAPGDKFMSIETWDMHGNAGVEHLRRRLERPRLRPARGATSR